MFDPSDLNRHFRYCWTLTGNEADAYDLLQAGLEKYLRQPPREERARHAYLRRILRHQFIDQCRHGQRHPLESIDTADIADAHTGMLEDLLVDGIDFERIWDTLPAFEREVLHYWAVEGYTAQEIADELELPRGTVLSRIHRVRARIRALRDPGGEVTA